ncbi:MAG: NADH-quinone oxidoreductase subunit H [Candidatus Marsarchaeota archaeon]|nr:NADH-quinone oxidoreductase subunit H [Candidatus Marsarchaeota archaeon]MCL5094404.1 NADH-quinone oxidoreductase subunit H [Candidatus Marsarchaeota archaeon]
MEINSPIINYYYNYIIIILKNFFSFIHVSYFNPYIQIVGLVIAIIVFLIALSLIVSLFVYFVGWIERKLMARMQSRHGPTYVGKFGILQNFADLVKLLSKEHINPDNADKIFPSLIPIAFALFFFMLIFIPITQNFIGFETSLGIIIIFALLSFSPLMMFLLGWTSGNKFSSISAQRSIMMMISYEIPMLVSLIPIIALAHGFNFSSVVNAQQHYWFLFIMPIGFIVFFITLLAELERQPFDLREADSELIAGWLNDVSAPYYALVLFIDYLRIFIGSLLISILFLGGWLGPSFLLPIFWILTKVIIITLIIILIRATMIRMRLDKIIKFGWNYLLPLAIINLFITFLIFIK